MSPSWDSMIRPEGASLTARPGVEAGRPASGATEAPSSWPRFLRGLSIGVFVGAAIAGSRIWGHRRRASDPQPGSEVEQGKAAS